MLARSWRWQVGRSEPPALPYEIAGRRRLSGHFLFGPGPEEAAELCIGELVLGEAEGALCDHFLGGAPDQREGGAREAAADADALDPEDGQLLHGHRLPGEADDDVYWRLDLLHERHDLCVVHHSRDEDAVGAGLVIAVGAADGLAQRI